VLINQVGNALHPLAEWRGEIVNDELRIKLEQAHRIMHMEGLAEDASRGHITAKSEDGRIYVKPWGMGFEEVGAQDFQAVDSDGKLLEGQGRIHSELILHLEIYRKRKDISSITHVHPYYSILLSSVFKGKIHILSHHATQFAGKIPFYTSPELIHSKEQAARLARTLGNGPVVLMKNHGITTVGKTVEEATIRAVHFEAAAKDHLLASTFGRPSGMPVPMAKKMSAHSYSSSQIQMLWDYYWKKFNRKNS
jgi:ribulose-5-phosphate 4-epimerase/fuculose-1-phosphate aldolase